MTLKELFLWIFFPGIPSEKAWGKKKKVYYDADQYKDKDLGKFDRISILNLEMNGLLSDVATLIDILFCRFRGRRSIGQWGRGRSIDVATKYGSTSWWRWFWHGRVWGSIILNDEFIINFYIPWSASSFSKTDNKQWSARKTKG